jgi:hypothetical protein
MIISTAVENVLTVVTKAMPLCENAKDFIRHNLEELRDGHKVKLVTIGTLTDKQLEDINANRARQELEPIINEVVFIGHHLYKSRVINDGYTIDDVLDQISGAMEECSEVVKSLKMTGIENPNPRADRYGNRVIDRAVFECSARHPRPELFSVIPKGDAIKPKVPKPNKPSK